MLKGSKKGIIAGFLLLTGTLVWANSEGVTAIMTSLVLQIGVVLFAARIGGMIMKKLKMPSVLGELMMGILIGPYLLGGIVFPGFPHGLFPLQHGLGVPVSTEIYAFATVASILLLFLSGLETDLSLFLAFSVKGAVIGISGVVFSFLAGAGAGAFFLGTPLMHPENLFLGILSIATSVGITARILSEQRKMDSPEGVTILAAAVIDDVLGIILLAVVLGVISVHGGDGGDVDWNAIGGIAFKAVGVWLLFTALGLLMARKIGSFLKLFGGGTSIAVLSLGLALLMAGIFEKAGLAMIIGAYVMGLSLSRTDISYLLQEKLHPVSEFFVPIFFCVMGMLVNLEVFLLPGVIMFGLIYSLVAIAAKILGCGIPSYFLNFNTMGALRVGVGMVPRGEVALIIAGIGIAEGILDDRMFGVAVLMTLVTTLTPPPVLTGLLKNKKRGTVKEMKGDNRVETPYSFPSAEMVDFARGKILRAFEAEDFYVHEWDVGHQAFQIRKDEVFIAMHCFSDHLEFSSDPDDVSFIRTMVYETLLTVHHTVDQLKNLARPEELRQEMAQDDQQKSRVNDHFLRHLKVENIIMDLQSEDKDGVIREMVDNLAQDSENVDQGESLQAVLDREATMSTGMQNGIAIPHGKTDGVKKMVYAIGLKREGMDFESLDGKPSNIFIMVLSPANASGPHIQFLASISAILKDEDARDELLKCRTPEEVRAVLLKRAHV